MILQQSPYSHANVNLNFNFPEVKVITFFQKEELEKRHKGFWGTNLEGDPKV